MIHAPRLQEAYNKQVVPAMREKFGYSSNLAVPRLKKVVVNCGVGRIRDDKQLAEIQRYLGLITGQKPSPRRTRTSIASFKTRAGMVVGYAINLRGRRMYDFVERLVSSAIPRMRDFRGIPLSGVDQGGALTIGIKEHIIFPETITEDVRMLFGLEVSIVTNASTRAEAIELFRLLGFPLQHG